MANTPFITDLGDLFTALELPLSAEVWAAADFPLKVSRSFVAAMERGNPHDPLLRQILPIQAEQQPMEGYTPDPLNEAEVAVVPGLLHRYRHRALLTLTSSCPIHCRYCFRRHYPYQLQNPKRDQLQQVADYLRRHPEIEELILSGGDPLMLHPRQLEQVSELTAALPNLTRLRLHTRLPVAWPEGVSERHHHWIQRLHLPLICVIHANHPQELTPTVADGLARLRQSGAVLLNQSVLLRGVNDSVAVLAALSRRLIACGVVPYYLHLLDRASGTAHFEVSRTEAVALMEQLHAELPGYLLPRLVQDEGSSLGKSSISRCELKPLV